MHDVLIFRLSPDLESCFRCDVLVLLRRHYCFDFGLGQRLLTEAGIERLEARSRSRRFVLVWLALKDIAVHYPMQAIRWTLVAAYCRQADFALKLLVRGSASIYANKGRSIMWRTSLNSSTAIVYGRS
jgi:hypothetical protein